MFQSSESTSVKSDELDPELKSAVHKLTSIISHKKSNSSALSAVIEVTVETIVNNSAQKSGKFSFNFFFFQLGTIYNLCHTFMHFIEIFLFTYINSNQKILLPFEFIFQRQGCLFQSSVL